MAWLLRELGKIKRCGEKAIVFCEFRDLQRTLQRAIAERFGFTPDVINGETSANSKSKDNRQKKIDAFQRVPGFGVIVLSPLAVGFGVNIQEANHVIHYTRTWNPAKEDQATDRAYRIGQERDVFVYYPVVVADDFVTFDSKLDQLLQWKRTLSIDMLNGAGDINPADFGDLEGPGGGNAFGDNLIRPKDISSMDPDAFEAFCALLWSKRGCRNTFKTPRVGDGGVDVVALRDKEGIVFQCKISSVVGKELGWEAVKDVAAGAPAYAERFPGIRLSMAAIINQYFNESARRQANVLHVELFDGGDLAEMLRENPVYERELVRFLLGGQAPS
jgi:Restriction endonuclease/Helicase conserved C-terminal domain